MINNKMSFVPPKEYRDFYSRLYNADNIHAELDKHYREKRKEYKIGYSKFIMNFLKYLTWTIKGTMIKDYPKSKIEKVLDISGFELNKDAPFKDINSSLKFKPVSHKTLKIFAIVATYFNTDAPELIPETGKVLPLVESMISFYNDKQTAKGGFGLVLGIDCKHYPFVIGKNNKRVYLTHM